MRRYHKQAGLIISLSPESPERSGVSFRVSGSTIAAVKLIFIILCVFISLITLLFVTRYKDYSRLLEKTTTLEQALGLKESELVASEAKIVEMGLATNQLIDELGRVGAMVREVQAFAGLEPEEVEITDQGLRQMSFAFGGSKASDLPVSSVDLLSNKLDVVVSEAHKDLNDLTESITEVRDTVSYKQEVAGATPSIWPIKGFISSYFGWRRSPISGSSQQHRGTDIVAPFRSAIAVTAPGKVITAGWSNSGYGNHVVVEHGHGFKTMYAHLYAIAVEPGDLLEIGDTVGELGNTGYSTGPHLHYEVWINDVPVDPSAYLP